MPVVSREVIKLDDEEARKQSSYGGALKFKKIITYSSTDDKFRIILPEYWHGPLGKKQVFADSRKLVNRLFIEARIEYEFRVKSKKKVIVYSFLSNIHIEIQGEKIETDDLNIYGEKAETTTGLAIWYQVAWETVTKEGGKKWYNLKGFSVDKPSYKSQFGVMDYTPEREEFFKLLSHEIAVLAFNAHSFLTQKELPQIIDHSRALPFLKKEDDD